MKRALKTSVIYILGALFLMLGIIGLVMPILQGVLFILIGLSILSLRWAWLRRLRERLMERYPWAGRQYASTRSAAYFVGRETRALITQFLTVLKGLYGVVAKRKQPLYDRS